MIYIHCLLFIQILGYLIIFIFMYFLACDKMLKYTN